MSASLVHRQRDMPDSRFIADLVGVFERRKIPVGDVRVCEHFEGLLATSDAFRSQLFTLCSAMSRMSPKDLTGEELLDLVGRALGVTKGAADLPESLRAEFLAGYDAWTHRDLIGSSDWPPTRKPPAREEVPREPDPRLAAWAVPAARPTPPPRPPGLPTVQEALELARQRTEVESPRAPQPAKAADMPEVVHAPAVPPVQPAENQLRLDTSALSIPELNALLKEIEERMARLSPHRWNAPATESASTVLPIRPEPVVPITPQAVQRSVPAEPAVPVVAPSRTASPYVLPLEATPVPSDELGLESASPMQYSEDEFLARHGYLQPQWRRDTAEPLYPAVPSSPPTQVYAPPAAETPDSAPTLVHTMSFVHPKPAGPPPAPDSLKLKMYVLIAALAGIVLVAAPLTGMMVYRSLHPVYVYHLPSSVPATAQPAETAPAPAANPANAKPHGRSKAPARKRQPIKRPPPAVAVWPPQPHF